MIKSLDSIPVASVVAIFCTWQFQNLSKYWGLGKVSTTTLDLVTIKTLTP